MFLGQLFEPDPMEKDLSPCTLRPLQERHEDFMFHAFELDMEHHQL